MNKIKLPILMLAIALAFSSGVNAQEIIIRERPARPHFERVAAPSPRHVWIEEEWEVRGGRHEFAGGRWVLSPYPGAVWIPGHWAQRPRGWVWIGGHWRRK